MPQFSTSIDIAAPVADVFALFADLPNATRIPGIVRVEMLTPGPVRKGTRFKETRKFMGKEATEELEVTAFDAGRSMSVGCTSHGATHGTRFDFVPAGGGTRVLVEYVLEPHSFMAKMSGGLMMGAIRKCIDEDIAAIKRAAESAAAR